jgi:hypothetical protein
MTMNETRFPSFSTSCFSLPDRTNSRTCLRIVSAVMTTLLAACLTAGAAAAAGAGAAQGASFRDLAADPGSGIHYQRAPSATLAIASEIQSRGTVRMEDFIGHQPIKPHGAPGVALLDADGDGDLDIYVTNGPGAANSLLENQLEETGRVSFVDVGAAAGVAATDQDSAGVCFGDIDNDGDPDLYVLGRSEPNRLFENQGDGTFQDITAVSGTGGGDLSSVSCSMGDVDGDGLLDIAVGNGFDMASSLAIFVEPFALNQRNQLFVNTGGNTFADLSGPSGVADAQDITWAIALVDLDQDGDADLIEANDNGGIPFEEDGGIDRGFVRFLANDGTGRFTDVTAERGLRRPGDWMGLAFADLDHNGTLDVFSSNSGDYFEVFLGLPIGLGDQATRWFLQNPDGTFTDPGVGGLVSSCFGWGNAAFDADNDGDADLLYFGGLDAGPFVESSNPGALLVNDGTGHFSFDVDAFDDGAPHSLRVEHGLAVGDLDRNGFPDVVSVSSIDLPAGEPPLALMPYPIDWGSGFDHLAQFFPTFFPGDAPGEFVFSGVEFPLGTLAVELNQGNRNGWLEVRALGTVGLTSQGRANRDGIGAVFRVTPWRGATAISPVEGGSSYASQHSLARTFGLGRARTATVEVLWPGGVRNRLYWVRSGERIVFPEIPCSFDAPMSPADYGACVTAALAELGDTGVLSPREQRRLLASALRAYAEEHP